MSKIEKKIIAIGGAGVTPKSDKKLDNFILNHSKKKKNNIGFLGTASKDDEIKINQFYKRFENTNSELSHFNLTSNINGFDKLVATVPGCRETKIIFEFFLLYSIEAVLIIWFKAAFDAL